MSRITAGGGVATLAATATVVVTDLTVRGVGQWWDRHSLIGSFVSSILILGIAVQVVDQVTARRRVKERERVAAVQALIVYGQARRTRAILLAPGDRPSSDPEAEVQALATMVLVAAPALFEDPTAREFMENVERFSAVLFRLARRRADESTESDRALLSRAEVALSAAIRPLLSRLRPDEVAMLEDAAPT